MGGTVSGPAVVAGPASAFASVGIGLGAARRHARLVLLIWVIFLVVALAAVWPAWAWWRGALEHAIEGDRLLGPNALPVLKELVHFDRTGAFGLVFAGLIGSALVALLLNPLIAGGLIGVLVADAGRPAGPRFFEIGARYYGPMLRTLLVTGVIALVVILLVMGLVGAVQDAVAERGAAMAALVLGVLQLPLMILQIGFFTAVLDLSRIRLIRHESRRAVPAVFRSLRVVLVRLPALALIGAVFLLLLALLAALTLGVRSVLPGASWGVLVAGLVLQQLFSLGRTALRIALIGAEIAIAPLPPEPVAEVVPAPVVASEPAPSEDVQSESATDPASRANPEEAQESDGVVTRYRRGARKGLMKI